MTVQQDGSPSGAPPALQRIVDLFGGAPKELRLQALLEYSRKVPPLPEELAGHRELMEQVPECATPFFLITVVDDDERGGAPGHQLHQLPVEIGGAHVWTPVTS